MIIFCAKEQKYLNLNPLETGLKIFLTFQETKKELGAINYLGLS